MSADTVDDLHAAEDLAGTLSGVLAILLPHVSPGAGDALVRARHAISTWETYCRPSCGAEGDPNSDECGDETCGCPCGHTAARINRDPTDREIIEEFIESRRLLAAGGSVTAARELKMAERELAELDAEEGTTK